MTIQERRPRIKEGSIHCSVRLMKHYIAQGRKGYVGAMEGMIQQLRTAYADPTSTDYDRAEYVWLGRRYAEAYKEITGGPCK